MLEYLQTYFTIIKRVTHLPALGPRTDPADKSHMSPIIEAAKVPNSEKSAAGGDCKLIFRQGLAKIIFWCNAGGSNG